MAAFNKINSFVEALAEKAHNLQSDALTVALTNTAPTAANTQLTDIVEIAYTNASSRLLTISSSAQTAGTYKLVIADLILSATGAVGPFRYIVVYNATSAGNLLIGWFDYGSAVTLQSGDSITLDFDATAGLLQLV